MADGGVGGGGETDLGRPRESWLKGRDHAKYAEAMLLCKHAGAYCSADGFCHYGGDCFEKQTEAGDPAKLIGALERRVRAIEEELADLKKQLARLRPCGAEGGA